MKLYVFRTVPLSIIRSYSLYTQQWCMLYRISMERSSILILLESSLQTCMTCTIAECTVNNSWWWTEELSETCTVSFQNKFEKLVHLVGFIIRNYKTGYSCSLPKMILSLLNGFSIKELVYHQSWLSLNQAWREVRILKKWLRCNTSIRTKRMVNVWMWSISGEIRNKHKSIAQLLDGIARTEALRHSWHL
jgi:hypothetical protein